MALGRYVEIRPGIRAFVPAPLPRHVVLAEATIHTLDRASRAVAMLAGIGELLPNPYLLIRPFVSREAVLSSKIEGTRTMLADLFLFEASGERADKRGDAEEVRNYVSALELGLAELKHLPMSVRLWNAVHERLLAGVRGEDRRPGELRTAQVYISGGVPGIEYAEYVPPPADAVRDLLGDLEAFANEETLLPPLVRIAMTHYQFETVHPYNDGNGRVGRLLIAMQLHAERVLDKPLLYLSVYFERRRSEYYAQLNRLRSTGDWDAWLAFFFTGVEEQAHDAIARARRVLDLHRRQQDLLREHRSTANAHALLDRFYEHPMLSTRQAATLLNMTPKGARKLLDRFVALGIAGIVPGFRPTVFVARDLLANLEQPIAAG